MHNLSHGPKAYSDWQLPALGFGTLTAKGYHGVDIVREALSEGYRLIDCAVNYENEGTIGTAVRLSDVDRSDIIVTTKLPGRHHAHDAARDMIEESVLRMGLDYIDLYLIHWPNPKQGKFVEAWEALLEARERGLIRHVGVSNFLPEHIDTLVSKTGVAPEINQIELHPYFPQMEQREYHEKMGIVTEAWSPLGRYTDLKEDSTITRIAVKHGVTPVQAILRWHLQLGTLPIPRSTDAERQRENLEIFDFQLDEDDMNTFGGLGLADGRLWDQDPAVYEEF